MTGNNEVKRGATMLAPGVSPPWLRPLVDNVADVPDAYRRRVPAELLATITAATRAD